MFPNYARSIVSNRYDDERKIVKNLYEEGYDKINFVSLNKKTELSEATQNLYYYLPKTEIEFKDYESFNNHIPKGFSKTRELFEDYRKANGIETERKHFSFPTLSEVRENYIQGNLFKEGDRVKIKSSQEKGVVTHCGSNYVIVEKHDDSFGRYWLEDVQIVEKNVSQDSDIKDREGTQPKKYYSGLKTKSTKVSRARHFEKGAEMDDDDPKAYEPAPGDATAKTKPSQHTNAYKKMFDRTENIEEGVYDPSIFKAIFMAGGPGSGKSFVVQNSALTALGFKVVNSDEKFEYLLKKAGMKATPEDIFSKKGQEIRGTAKTLTTKQQDNWIDGRLGLVIDGTGKDYVKITKQANSLKELGYDVGMIFVNTNLETAIERDKMRPRSLGAEAVTKMWKVVQDNIGKFQNYFGSNFTVVDNSTDSDFDNIMNRTYKKMVKFSKEPPKNPVARKWIKDQLKESTLYEQDPVKAVKNKADETGVDYDILKQVFDRGVAAWRTGHRPGTTAAQWGLARINSFVTGGKTQSTADKDLAKKAGLIKESEMLSKPTPSPKEIAKKHGVDLKVIEKQLEMGIEVEMEHTDDKKIAREIALDHLNELPDYYSRLKKVEESWASKKFKEIYVNRFRNKNEKLNSILHEGVEYKTKNEIMNVLINLDNENKNQYRVFKNLNNQIEFKKENQ
jgi:shikimate kinase